MKKVVINKEYGGFSLSDKAFKELVKMNNEYALKEKNERDSWEKTSFDELFKDSWLRDIPRDNKDLIVIVEKLGHDADGMCASLKVIEIPDVDFIVEEYDGREWVSEKHRTWS